MIGLSDGSDQVAGEQTMVRTADGGRHRVGVDPRPNAYWCFYCWWDGTATPSTPGYSSCGRTTHNARPTSGPTDG
jgi:hypothetical protein